MCGISAISISLALVALGHVKESAATHIGDTEVDSLFERAFMASLRQRADDQKPETFDETALGKPSSSVAMRHGSGLRGALSPLFSEPRRSASASGLASSSGQRFAVALGPGQSGTPSLTKRQAKREVASRRAPSLTAEPGLKLPQAASHMSSASDGGGAARSRVGLVGLAVMGQNLALNIAEKGFPISVFNRSPEKTDNCVARALKEGLDDKVSGYKDMSEFVRSLQKPRSVIILVKAGAAVDATIAGLMDFLEPGDTIIDGGNEWYENTERRAAEASGHGILYLGMGVSGGEEGARNGPSLMPGGSKQAYSNIAPLLAKVSAQVDDGSCVTYVGEGGAGNFVKMVHNGIEYGDMQLISEAYDLLKTVGGLSNQELAAVFQEWNGGELQSFLIQITADIMAMKDDHVDDGSFLVDKILDKTGMKGTGKWTVQQAAELSVAAPTIEASLDSRFLSGIKEERVAAAEIFDRIGSKQPSTQAGIDKKALVEDVRSALYASKVCSYAQGMNIIRAKSEQQGWGIDYGEIARIWKGGCIIRAIFLDRIKGAYDRNGGQLASLLVDKDFAQELAERQPAWRRVVALGVVNGVALPGMSASLAYFDSYRRKNVPANLVQAQRDYFGSHTYERNDGKEGSFHTIWSDANSADSITTSGYKN
jgi:6-phosphogluconate dehydrogenase